MTRAERQVEDRLDTRIALYSGALTYALTLGHLAVNAASRTTDLQRVGQESSFIFSLFIEGSSVFYILALFWGVAAVERRFALVSTPWRIAVPVHLAAIAAFSTLHVFAMAWTREALAPVLFGIDYTFFENPMREFIYELRKDVLTYMTQFLVLTGFRAAETSKLEVRGARAEARQTRRLTLKCGGRIIRLDAGAFTSARAAGNYVEVHTGQTEHLARMTLGELENQLAEAGIDAVRVHRSWLVNRDAIAEIVPTGEGDVRIRLGNGTELPGSRRYRDRLLMH
mgnify:CR=1 FL=1